ncbi:MAG: phosphoenolpyruvate carboxylase [Pseudomonadales bacterium]
MDTDIQLALRDNVRLLGGVLGDTIREQVGEHIYLKVEEIRSLAKEAHQSQDWQPLLDVMSGLQDYQLVPVARAFTQFLNYANIAEQHHRVRRRLSIERAEAAPEPGTMTELLPRLKNAGVSADDIYNTVSSMGIELVLTAHPTEVSRRTLLRKHHDIAYILKRLDSANLTPQERESQISRLRRRIIASWHTDEIRRHQPTPVDEAKWGFATIESTLWEALPEFLRKLDKQLLAHTGRRLPLNATPLRFASWMGGDRDGNPNVTSVVTEEVLLLARWEAADLLAQDIHELREDLSMGDCNAALLDYLGREHREPYREVLRDVRTRLRNTRLWAEAKLKGEDFDGAIYLNDEDLLEPLQVIYQSLLDCGMEEIAEGSLINIIRRVACFGLTLSRLDIRQESTRHADVINEITEYLKLGSYNDWSEDQKQAFLLAELQNPRPLISDSFPASPDVAEVLRTFKVLAKQPASALGAYIISMATHPSDVLAVRLLQLETGCKHPQRIVPLFETLDDLEGAQRTIDRLLSIDWYKNDIAGHQEVMIGYSDSAKDAGFFAASWAQYRTQETLSTTCKEHGVRLTLFHGRGGSASRGGGPARDALLSQPPGTINGSVRVTEQGEMIESKFGLQEIAQENIELYVCGTLEATLAPPAAPKDSWRTMMQALADESVTEYRRIVHHDPRFVPYFRCVTPEQELRRLALGSRPAKRKASGGIESLRAIPWVFAWTQMRLMLPAWLGTGKALASQLEQGHLIQLQEMAQQWTYFGMLLDMQEMVMAKTEQRVAAYYEQRLLEDDSQASLGTELRAGVEQAESVLQQISGQGLLEKNPDLKRSIELRNPYVDPLNITQAEVMRRLRLLDEDDSSELKQDLEQALMVSIGGIAAGLRNTG